MSYLRQKQKVCKAATGHLADEEKNKCRYLQLLGSTPCPGAVQGSVFLSFGPIKSSLYHTCLVKGMGLATIIMLVSPAQMPSPWFRVLTLWLLSVYLNTVSLLP